MYARHGRTVGAGEIFIGDQRAPRHLRPCTIAQMKTPYVPHLFGGDVQAKLREHRGWISAGIATSIAWPWEDVWVEYNGHGYLLRGVDSSDDHRRWPCINTPADHGHIDEAMAKLYHFTSTLGFFMRGFVDVTGYISGSHPTLYGDRNAETTTLLGRGQHFCCNHMPVVDDDRIRMALAFLREGRRLEHVYAPYSFLSYFKVLESQLPTPNDRIDWIRRNLDLVTDERAVRRIQALRENGVDVADHLWKSGRCAVAHAGVGREIVDPDLPADRRRIAEDLGVVAALADRYIRVDAGVPNVMDLYDKRDRTASWHALMKAEAVNTLKAGGAIQSVEDLGPLAKATISVRLWPEAPAKQFAAMALQPVGSSDGAVDFVAITTRRTIGLAFRLDIAHGRVHTALSSSGLVADANITAEDVEDFTRYFHSVLANRIVELAIQGTEPIDCDVVIPTNIMPRNPEEAVAEALEQFKSSTRATSPDPEGPKG